MRVKCLAQEHNAMSPARAQNLENWLENLRIISAPGFTSTNKQMFLSHLCYVMYLCTRQNKGVVELVMPTSVRHRPNCTKLN